MSDALGLIAMVIFIIIVIAFAAGVTWLVVKYTPTRRSNKTAR